MDNEIEMIYMNKEKGFMIIVLELTNRFFRYEADFYFGKLTVRKGFAAPDIFHRDYEYIGDL